jgi:hypothetical protein
LAKNGQIWQQNCQSDGTFDQPKIQPLMQKIDKSDSKIVKVMEHLISRKFDHYWAKKSVK